MMNISKKITLLVAIGIACGMQPFLQGRGGDAFGGAFAGGMVSGLMTGAMQPREKTVVVEKGGDNSGAINALRDEIYRLRSNVRQDLENLRRAIQDNSEHIRGLKTTLHHIKSRVESLERDLEE